MKLYLVLILVVLANLLCAQVSRWVTVGSGDNITITGGKVVGSVQELKATSASIGSILATSGRNTPNDGGATQYIVMPSPIVAGDTILSIPLPDNLYAVPAAFFSPGGRVNLAALGVVPNVTTDYRPRLQAIANATQTYQKALRAVFAPGSYRVALKTVLRVDTADIDSRGAIITYPANQTNVAKDNPTPETWRTAHIHIKNARKVRWQGGKFYEDANNTTWTAPPGVTSPPDSSGYAGAVLYVTYGPGSTTHFDGEVQIEDVEIYGGRLRGFAITNDELDQLNKRYYNNIYIRNVRVFNALGNTIRGVHRSVVMEDCYSEMDMTKAVLGYSDADNANLLSFVVDNDLQSLTNVVLRNCVSKYGGLFYGLKFKDLTIDNCRASRIGYFKRPGQADGYVVLGSWKDNNAPADPQYLGYNGVNAIKVNSEYAENTSVNIINTYITEVYDTDVQTGNSSMDFAKASENNTITGGYIWGRMRPEEEIAGYQRNFRFNGVTFYIRNAVLIDGASYDGCYFRAPQGGAADNVSGWYQQSLPERRPTNPNNWEDWLAFTSGAQREAVTFNGCHFINSGIQFTPGQKMIFKDCSFREYSGIIIQGGADETGMLILDGCTGGKIRSNLLGGFSGRSDRILIDDCLLIQISDQLIGEINAGANAHVKESLIQSDGAAPGDWSINTTATNNSGY